MPIYHRIYMPGELQFITTSTYRPVPVFPSARFCQVFVQRLEEVRQKMHCLLLGWVLMPEQSGEARAGQVPRRLAVVKLALLLLA